MQTPMQQVWQQWAEDVECPPEARLFAMMLSDDGSTLAHERDAYGDEDMNDLLTGILHRMEGEQHGEIQRREGPRR